jgi:ABC-type sugar transport system permease subunit
MLILLVVQIYPTLYSLWLSLNRARAGQLTFVGLDNYSRLFRDTGFSLALGNTVQYAFWYILLTIGLGMLLAVLLNRRVKLTGAYLVAIFIPWVISDVVAGTIWRWMFQESYGIIQYWFGNFQLALGADTVRSLTTTHVGAMGIVVVASVWRALAFTTLLFLGALQTVPAEVLESAALDGAGGWTAFLRITFPIIRPTFLVSVLLTSIRAINSAGMILTIMKDSDLTRTAALYMLTAVQRDGDFGLAAATSVVLFFINITLTVVYLRLVTTSEP